MAYQHITFNEVDQERYANLGVKTHLKDKIKQLFNEFCEKQEARARELSHDSIREKTEQIVNDYSSPSEGI